MEVLLRKKVVDEVTMDPSVTITERVNLDKTETHACCPYDGVKGIAGLMPIGKYTVYKRNYIFASATGMFDDWKASHRFMSTDKSAFGAKA